MSSNGALISSALSARVHWTLGRGTLAKPDEAGRMGDELIQLIQGELSSAHQRGVQLGRKLEADHSNYSEATEIGPIPNLQTRDAMRGGHGL